MNLDIHAPVTQQPGTYMAAASPRPRRLATGGYITYATHGFPSNAAGSHPGWGATPEASVVDAAYWANQAPWVTTVRASRAPKAVREWLANRDDDDDDDE